MKHLVITDKHNTFLEGVLSGDRIDVAAKKAGFGNPTQDAYPILTHPEVQRRFIRVIRGKANTEGLVSCYNYLVEVVNDKTQLPRARIDAAKFLYAHHMPSVKAEEAQSTYIKPVNEMNNQELDDYISKMADTLKQRLIPAQGIDDML